MVVETRSKKKMEGFGELIDEKLGEFKIALVSQFQATLDSYINGKIVELEALFSSKMKALEEVSKKNELLIPESSSVNEELRESVKAIEKHVMEVRHENIILRNQVDDLKQYIRRPNLRIFGVPLSPGEKSENVNELVETMVTSAGIHSSSIDRAHRVGRITARQITKDVVNSDDDEVVEKTTIKYQPIIVRFTSFRDRTLFYKARKQVKERFSCSISLDLTAERYSLLKYARKKVENVAGIKFVYSDINCSLRALTADGKHLFFDSVCALDDIILAANDSVDIPANVSTNII